MKPTLRKTASLMDTLKTMLRHASVHRPLSSVAFPRWRFMITPGQMAALVGLLDETREIPGAILEIGCAWGWTTTLLNKHMDYTELNKEYVCIDTFSGFTPEDIATEQSQGRPYDFGGFRGNSKAYFDSAMRLEGFQRIKSYEADAATLDMSRFAPVSFCFIDLDLYRPVLGALREVRKHMSPGGVIAVHDCMPDHGFEGAYYAYLEYVKEIAREPEIIAPAPLHNSALGLVRC